MADHRFVSFVPEEHQAAFQQGIAVSTAEGIEEWAAKLDLGSVTDPQSAIGRIAALLMAVPSSARLFVFSTGLEILVKRIPEPMRTLVRTSLTGLGSGFNRALGARNSDTRVADLLTGVLSPGTSTPDTTSPVPSTIATLPEFSELPAWQQAALQLFEALLDADIGDDRIRMSPRPRALSRKFYNNLIKHPNMLGWLPNRDTAWYAHGMNLLRTLRHSSNAESHVEIVQELEGDYVLAYNTFFTAIQAVAEADGSSWFNEVEEGLSLVADWFDQMTDAADRKRIAKLAKHIGNTTEISAMAYVYGLGIFAILFGWAVLCGVPGFIRMAMGLDASVVGIGWWPTFGWGTASIVSFGALYFTNNASATNSEEEKDSSPRERVLRHFGILAFVVAILHIILWFLVGYSGAFATVPQISMLYGLTCLVAYTLGAYAYLGPLDVLASFLQSNKRPESNEPGMIRWCARAIFNIGDARTNGPPRSGELLSMKERDIHAITTVTTLLNIIASIALLVTACVFSPLQATTWAARAGATVLGVVSSFLLMGETLRRNYYIEQSPKLDDSASMNHRRRRFMTQIGVWVPVFTTLELTFFVLMTSKENFMVSLGNAGLGTFHFLWWLLLIMGLVGCLASCIGLIRQAWRASVSMGQLQMAGVAFVLSMVVLTLGLQLAPTIQLDDMASAHATERAEFLEAHR